MNTEKWAFAKNINDNPETKGIITLTNPPKLICLMDDEEIANEIIKNREFALAQKQSKFEILKEFRYEDSEESVTNFEGPSIFLAGPTVRGNQPHLTSWRFEAIEEFKKQGFAGALIIPEFTLKTESDKGKKWVPLWEMNGLKRADCILFWIPRTKELIGLTTNWELGFWMGKNIDKITYGRPDDGYRIDYLDTMWETEFCGKGNKNEIHNTLEKTVEESIKKANELYRIKSYK